MSGSTPRNPLMPWLIGLAVILVALSFVGYQVVTVGCGGAPTVAVVMALLVAYAAYLGPMYVTLKSQE